MVLSLALMLACLFDRYVGWSLYGNLDEKCEIQTRKIKKVSSRVRMHVSECSCVHITQSLFRVILCERKARESQSETLFRQLHFQSCLSMTLAKCDWSTTHHPHPNAQLHLLTNLDGLTRHHHDHQHHLHWPHHNSHDMIAKVKRLCSLTTVCQYSCSYGQAR
jgi:hypothetical protein